MVVATVLTWHATQRGAEWGRYPHKAPRLCAQVR